MFFGMDGLEIIKVFCWEKIDMFILILIVKDE